jgi:hypothetical protein
MHEAQVAHEKTYMYCFEILGIMVNYTAAD